MPRDRKFDPEDGISLPNIYAVTIQNHDDGKTYSFHVAADFTGAAIAKLQRICADQYGFRPHRSFTDIKMQRMRLQHYVQNPQLISTSYALALRLGESDIAGKLANRAEEITAAIYAVADRQGFKVDHSATTERLAAMLEEYDQAVIRGAK